MAVGRAEAPQEAQGSLRVLATHGMSKQDSEEEVNAQIPQGERARGAT